MLLICLLLKSFELGKDVWYLLIFQSLLYAPEMGNSSSFFLLDKETDRKVSDCWGGGHFYRHFQLRKGRQRKKGDLRSHIQEVKGLSLIMNLQNIEGHH